MSKILNLKGHQYGRLKVVRLAGRPDDRPIRWECQCLCGNTTVVGRGELRKGTTQSCGCLMIERTKQANTKHGMKGTKVYAAWGSMIDRCCNKKGRDYARWGARGIKICRRWRKFSNFLEDMGNPLTKKHSLGRKENDGNYCKENCEWQTATQQARNRRNSKFLIYKGKRQTIAAWEDELGFRRGRVAKRIRKGWGVIEALTTSVNSNFNRY